MVSTFRAHQFAPGGKMDRDRSLMFSQINKFSYIDYVVSVLVRLAPVLICGAILGIWLRSIVGLARLPESAQEKIDTGIRMTWREVVVNIMGAGVINILVYAWNVTLPLSAPNR